MPPVTRKARVLKCLVTGGGGFLGRHIVDQLLESGRYEVTVFDIRAVEGDERAGLTYVVGDLRKAEDVDAACAGVWWAGGHVGGWVFQGVFLLAPWETGWRRDASANMHC
jgi:nucleoside-diphosphate-sugar epimerase